MKLTEHPEYHRVYVKNKDAFQVCYEAVAQWKTSNGTISVPHYSLQWNYESAQAFVRSLSRLFQEYNRVLWQRFHYCRQCGGQCCVVDASDVQPFDLIAMALLDRTAPSLPETITAGGRTCIYLSNRQCSWPDEWRTIKCWSFYCLGVGPWRTGATIGELRSEIRAELQQLVHELLPDPLRKYEAVQGISLADSLDDPVGFSHTLHQALFEIFVGPFNQIYPIMNIEEASDQESSVPSQWQADEVSALVTEVAEQIDDYTLEVPEELEISPEQVLEDLESLQWIIEGHPSHGLGLLEEMKLRYARASDAREDPTIWYRMHMLILSCLSEY